MDDVITIFIDANTKAFKKGTQAVKTAVESLNRTTKQFTGRAISSFKRLIPLVAGVGTVFGVLSKSVSTYMSQHEELGKKLNAVWTTLGNLIGPIIERIVDLIATATSYFVGLLNVFGVTSKKASELSKSTGAVVKTLAGFDELNVLQDNSGGSLDDKELPKTLSKIAELLKNKMWDEAADLIIEKLNGIIAKVHEKAIELGDKLAEPFQGLTHVLARVLDETNWKELGAAVADFFNHLFQEIDGLNIGEDLGKILVAPFTIGFKILTGFLETLDWARFGTIISEGIKGALGSITSAIEGADFQKIGAGIKAFFENIDWNGILEKVKELLKALWDGALEFLKGLVMGDTDEEPPTIGALKRLGDAIAKFGDVFAEILGDTWTDIKTAIKDILESETVADVIDKIASAIETFGKFCKEHKDVIVGLLEGIGGAIVGYKLAEGIMKVVSAVTSLFNPTTLIIAAIVTVIGYLVHLYLTNEEFRDKVNAAWEAVKTAIGTVVDWIVDKWEKLKEGFNTLKQKFEEGGLAGVWDTIKTGIGTAIDNMKAKFEDLKTGLGSVRDKFGELKDKVSEKWQGLKEKLHVDELKTKLVEGFGAIKDKVVEKFTSLKGDVTKTAEKLKQDLTTTFSQISKKTNELKKAYEDMTKLMKEKNSELEKSVEQDFSKIQELVETSAEKCVEKMEKSWEKISKSVESGASSVVKKADGMANSLTKQYDAIKNAADKQFSLMQTNVTKYFSTMASNVDTTGNKMKTNVGKQFDDIKTKATTTTQTMGTDVNTKYTTMGTSVTTTMSRLGDSVTKSFNSLASSATQVVTRMSSSITNALSSMSNNAVRVVSNMGGPITNTFRTISSYAYSWGQDLAQSYANGISSRAYAVANAANAVANAISRYLHFTEPDVGPLRNFHTFGPDMMKLYAEGISGSSDRVMKAVSAVAEGVSDRLSENEFGLGSSFNALENISKNVSWSMPAVAGGGILPYGVSASTAQGVETNASVSDAVAKLNETILGLQDSLENMQWVAQFGSVRAFVRECRKVERQMDRAEGR